MNTQKQTSEVFLTPAEVAKLLRVSAMTFERIFARGELACYRFGRQRRIKRTDLET